MASFNKYTVIKNAVSYELANFCYNYFLLKRDAIGFMYDNNLIAQNSFFSGAYYVKVPKNSGQIKFNDPRSGPKYIFPNQKNVPLPEHLWKELHVEPVENRVIMFPAWLEHLVDLNQSDETRISVSFNFTQHGLF